MKSKQIDPFTSSPSFTSTMLQDGNQYVSWNESGIHQSTFKSKRTREFFEDENKMNVDIVDDTLESREENGHNSDIMVQSDVKRIRRKWRDGNMDSPMGVTLSSPDSTLMASSEKSKTIPGSKRNRFQHNSYCNFVTGLAGEVRPEDEVDNALKKLKVNDANNTKLPMSRRLPIVNDLNEKSDVDFASVNQVLNELYRERCFRKNMSVTDSLSNNIFNSSGDNCFIGNDGVISSALQKFGRTSTDILDVRSCSSMPP